MVRISGFDEAQRLLEQLKVPLDKSGPMAIVHKGLIREIFDFDFGMMPYCFRCNCFPINDVHECGTDFSRAISIGRGALMIEGRNE